ncbi:MAG: cellulose biosynthesis protein BcsS [Pseudolabrys sp.]
MDFEKHWLWPHDPQNALQGSDTGLRMAAEFWYEPTPTTMAVFEASISTIATNHSMRAAFGFRVLQEQFYFGPEIAYFGSDGYRHLRLGGHFTALKTERIEWSAAGGWAGDSGGRVSPYARLGLFQRL